MNNREKWWEWHDMMMMLASINYSLLELRTIKRFHLFLNDISHSILLVGHSQGWPEGSLFNSYNTDELERLLLFSLD